MSQFSHRSPTSTCAIRRHCSSGYLVATCGWLVSSISPTPLFNDELHHDTTNTARPLEPGPEESATHLSRVLFCWLSQLVVKGYRKVLTAGDMYQLLRRDTCRSIVPRFEKEWQKELKNTNYSFIAEKTPPNDDITENPKHRSKSTSKEPSVLKAVWRAFGGHFMIGAVFKLAYDVTSFLNPLILNLLITLIQEKDSYAWYGYVYAVILFAVSVAKLLILQQYWHVCFVTGMHLRTAITAAVYKKSLVLSNKARNETTVGAIVNLMAVDTQKIMEAPGYIHMLWSTPVTICIAMYFLWQQLGPSSLAGLGIMLLLVPLNVLVATKFRSLQISQMKYKDSRMKLANEVLNGIKVLKLYAWEKAFSDRVNEIREKELHTLKMSQYLNVPTAFSWYLAPFLVGLGTFAVYVLSSPDHILDANKAFVSLTLFNILNYPLSILPAVFIFGVQGYVSLDRVNTFLKRKELAPDNISKEYLGTNAIVIEDGSFSWAPDEPPVINDVNMEVLRGQLVAVVGKVGSGKSSLISAMIGEMELMRGKVKIQGSTAYVPQQAWIQNATVRDNILLGKPYHSARYTEVIEACALKPDLQILTGGDMTEVGDKGINLSGGQKQRVALARAVYRDSDVYLLDDPLSAVDAHVGKHIFEKVIGDEGLLKDKTRILATNSLTYLAHVDVIVVLRHGVISEMGTYEELMGANGAFSEFVRTYLEDLQQEGELDLEEEHILRQLSQQLSVDENQGMTERNVSESDRESLKSNQSRKTSLSRTRSRVSRQSSCAADDVDQIRKDEKRVNNIKLTEEEAAMSGNVKLDVLKVYFRGFSGLAFVSVLVFFFVTMAAQIYANIWLSSWSNDKPINGTQDMKQRDLRLSVYGGVGCIQAVSVVCLMLAQAVGCVRASRALHATLFTNILRAPMYFFDTTPIGRIINRLTRDVDTVDTSIPNAIRIWLNTVNSVLATLFIIAYSTPIFLIVVVPLGLLYYFAQRFYISTSRQLRRIDSIVRSPIYTHFETTITGASSIRAYQLTREFTQRTEDLLDYSQTVYYPVIVANRWIGVWLDFIGTLIVLFAALFAVIEKDTITGGLAGLSITYALQVTANLNMMVRMSSDLETYIVSVERIDEYSQCPTEAVESAADEVPSSSWPDHGRVTFDKYATRYRPGLDLVLKHISLEVLPGERVGIVGRTGAGKSSLTLALFRILEAFSGDIIIDNQRISKMALRTLRSRLTIIPPQDPVLFSGSLRQNLDPFEKHSDDEVWNALQHSHLKTFIAASSAALQMEVTEGGGNLSVGQRQLVCLARALLRHTKILVLDEATAAVDLETDDLIQATIRAEFTDSTIITIAHRLNTIMDYDRVIVLDQGKIVEFDRPDILLTDTQTVFYGMAKDAGLA